MNIRMTTMSLALIAGMGSLALPSVAHAGNVGYYKACTLATVGDPSGIIAAAGHTQVAVASINAASLNGLDALFITDCYSNFLSTPNADLNAAVQNGMSLVIESMYAYSAPNGTAAIDSANLPGAPTFFASSVHAFPEADDIEIPVGSPVATGPGGALTATSLDRIPAGSGGTYNMTHYYPSSALPSGTTALLTTANPSHVGAFSYPVGNGRVALSETQFSLFLPGGEANGNGSSFQAGGITYLTNLLAWAARPSTTCASEGYKGAKLTWCQNICENGLTGQVLDTWIHRWINRYRVLPYCAVEQPENPPQET